MGLKAWREVILAVTLSVVMIMPTGVYASEVSDDTDSSGVSDNHDSSESMTLPTSDGEIVSVILPTEASESPIDFYIDPEGLIYLTDAAKYGGGRVEEGAHILFHNHDDGEYDFSSKSDPFKITNQSTVPVDVTITARVENLGSIELSDSRDFPEDNAAIYLALLDDEGNERALSADEDVSVTVNMSAASMSAYAYVYDEDAGEYRYGYLVNPGDDYFDTYSFGLTGDCNESDAWAYVSESPRVTVTWKVEPQVSDEDGVETEPGDEQIEEEMEDETGEDVLQVENASENTDVTDSDTAEEVEQGEDDSQDEITDTVEDPESVQESSDDTKQNDDAALPDAGDSATNAEDGTGGEEADTVD